MSNNDTFLTVYNPSQGLYKEKGSKFIAYLFHVDAEEEIKDHLARIKKEHHDARHQQDRGCPVRLVFRSDPRHLGPHGLLAAKIVFAAKKIVLDQ